MPRQYLKQLDLLSADWKAATATVFQGDSGILHTTSVTGLNLINIPGIRAVIWTPQDNILSGKATALSNRFNALTSGEQDMVSTYMYAINNGREIDELPTAALHDVFENLQRFSLDAVEMLGAIHANITKSNKKPVNTRLLTIDPAIRPPESQHDITDLVPHIDMGLSTRLIYIPFGPGTIMYDLNGQAHSLPADSILIFKGGKHDDAVASLRHQAPEYDTPTPRLFLSNAVL